MSERDEIDALLRQSLAATAPPTLPPTFTERITRQLAPRRLTARARQTLGIYALVAVGACVVVMRSLGLEWSLVGASLAVTAAIGAVVRARLG